MKKILKIIGYTLLGMLVLLIALGVILPKDFTANVEHNIDAPPNYIYNVISDPSIRGWNHLEFIDTSATFDFIDKVGTGGGFSWSSEEGTGKMIIHEVQPNKSLSNHVFFNGEDNPKSTTYTLTPKESSTNINVEWSGNFGFPINIMGPFIKRKVSSRISKELDRLSTIIKTRKEDGIYRGYQVLPLDFSETYYIANRSEVNEANVQQFYSQNLSNIFRSLQEGGIETIGPDCALIYNFYQQRNEVDLAAALPVGEDVAVAGASTIILPRANAVSVDFYGNRANSAPAHQAINEYLRDRNLQAQVPYVEEYITNVLEEKDPSKWLTKITYRIAE